MLSYKNLRESCLTDSQWLAFFRTLTAFQKDGDPFSEIVRGYYLLKDEEQVRVFFDIQPDDFLEHCTRDPGLDGGGPFPYEDIAWVLLPIQAQVTQHFIHRFAREVKVHSMHQLFLRKLIALLNTSGPFPIQHTLAMTEEERLVLPLLRNYKGLDLDLELWVSEYLLI